MTQTSSTTPTDALIALLPREEVMQEAQRLGVLVRRRVVDIYALTWTLVMPFQEGSRGTISSLHRAYQSTTKQILSRSSFYERFTPKLAILLRTLAQEAITSFGSADFASRVVPKLLVGFRELLVLDATVVRLHALLAKGPTTRPHGGGWERGSKAVSSCLTWVTSPTTSSTGSTETVASF